MRFCKSKFIAWLLTILIEINLVAYPLVVSTVVTAPVVTPTSAYAQTTPTSVQNNINAVPWTTGLGKVTGATIESLLTQIVSLIGIFAPPAGGVVTATVGSNAGLATLLPAAYSQAIRLGYATTGDSPTTTYTLSSTPCSLNAGSGDGGSQVRLTAGGCANAVLGTAASAAVWGVFPYSVCVAGGTSSATCIATLQAQMQAAINYSGTAQVSLTIPCGTYETSGALIVGANTYITGPVGPGTLNCVTISGTSGTLDDLDVTGTLYYIGYINFDKTITASAGTGVYVASDLSGRLDHVLVQDNYVGFLLGATANSNCDFCIAQENYSNGFTFNTSSALAAMQWQLTHSISQQNNGVGFSIYVSSSSPAAGNATDPTFLDSGSYANTGGGFLLSGDAGTGNNDLSCYHCYSSFDGNNGFAWQNIGFNNLLSNTFVEFTGGGPTGRGQTTAASNVGWGLLVNGTVGGPASLAITGGAFSFNSYAGISTNTGLTATINVSNTIVFDNGAATPGLYGAVYVQSPGMTLTGVTAGNLANTRAPYGLQVSSAAIGMATIVSGSTFSGTTSGCSYPVNGAGNVGSNCAGVFVLNASASQATTTGSISATHAALTLASALDWINGEGIVVPGAGAAFAGSSPSSLGLTITGGASTSYAYTVACIDANGGEGVAPTAVTTAVGPTTINNSSHYIKVAWTAGSGCTRYAVYGNTLGSMTFMGVTPQTFFYDYGRGAVTAPPWATSTVPSVATNDWLLTSVLSGQGTTALVLANNATHSVSNATVYHSDDVAIQAAVNTLPTRGGVVDIGTGIYNLFTGLTIGNGGVGSISTKTGVVLKGDNAAINGFGWSGYGAAKGAAFNWMGSSNASVVDVSGPLQGWGVQNVSLLCNDYGTYGLYIQSAQFGDSKNLYMDNCQYGIESISVPAFGGNGTDALHNQFNNININNQDYNQSYAWRLDGDTAGGTSDTDYTDAHNVIVSGQTTALNVGVDFITSDSNYFDNIHFSGTWASGIGQSVVFDYTDSYGGGSTYPNSNILTKIDPGGAGSGAILVSGTYSGSSGATNQIWQVSGANGGTCATPSGVTCHAN